MTCQGVVKSFFDHKAFGFITLDGKDVFVHIKDCNGAKPVEGDTVLFDLDPEKAAEGKMKALNVQGCTGSVEDMDKGKGKGKGGGMAGGGSCQGTVKSFSVTSGWGFIDMSGQDVFCHLKECVGNPLQAGDVVSFDVEESPSKPGSFRAKSISGGTGWPLSGGGDAWGCAKGGWKGCGGGYGPAYGMGMKGGKGSWGGPYGGYGGGKDFGKGKGGWNCGAKGGW